MEKEKRHLIQEKVDELVHEYEVKSEEAKSKGDLSTAFAMTMAQNGVLRLSYEILSLDALGKI